VVTVFSAHYTFFFFGGGSSDRSDPPLATGLHTCLAVSDRKGKAAGHLVALSHSTKQ